MSPLLAGALGAATYVVLTRASPDRDADFIFRLSITALAMAAPAAVAFLSGLRDLRTGGWSSTTKAGLGAALLSLGLLYLPISGAIARARQAAHLALAGVPAPEMVTPDIDGNPHRLSDYRGKVVLLNIWATWCPPCKREMPELDRLRKEGASEGLVVLGLSMEDIETQRKFAQEEVRVGYPLLAPTGDIPEIFSTTARYPANFLIDREGNLHPAPSTDKPFSELETAVDRLLRR
jgi:peroxiredoxin